jgi:hypothetical protein
MASASDNVHPYLDVEANITIRGIELRTYIAVKLMAARRSQNTFGEPAYIAKNAVLDADALIAELNK